MKANHLNAVFYLKQLESGNLVGEYFNDKMQRRGTESCDIKNPPDPNAPFVGEYYSSWWDKKPDGSTLKIDWHKKEYKTYKLTWSDGSRELCVGIGMLHEGILIGECHENPQA
jgi:hypothetical protein